MVRTMKQNENTPRTYEEAYAELQQIVSALQQEQVSIDDLAAFIERAQLLIQFCRERLRQVEKRLEDNSDKPTP